MTDQEILSQIQRHLIETPDGGASWSALWTAEEVLGYLNQRQQQLLRETHAEIGLAEVEETQGQAEVTLPEDWLATVLVLRSEDGGPFRELPQMDTHTVDTGIGDTQTAGTPKAFVDAESPTLTAQILPPPATAGLLELYYVPLADTVDGSGQTMALPPEWLVCGVKWGVIADMLGKVGRGRDDSRIRWAEERYRLVVEVLRLALSGGF